MTMAGVRPAGAQIVQFTTTEVGDRRVVLNWDPLPGDTLDAEDRQDCKVNCEELLPDTVAVAECKVACEEFLFGGYQIWRSTADDTTTILLRTYAVLDSTWTFTGRERTFVDSDSVIVRACGEPIPNPDCNPSEEAAIPPFNGFPYYYYITWFESTKRTISGSDRVFEIQKQTTDQGRLEQPLQPSAPAVTTPPLLGKVLVVPNPFNLSDPFHRASFGNENRVQFINLPTPATVRIYTPSGDLIRTLENNDNDNAIDWDLKNGDGDDVVGGIYMFHVETPAEVQARSGHFVIIR
jgi:hypothetical protein